MKLNETLHGLTVIDTKKILPIKSLIQKYSIYSKGIDSSKRIISCEMVTIVVQSPKLTDKALVCRKNCGSHLNRYVIFELQVEIFHNIKFNFF